MRVWRLLISIAVLAAICTLEVIAGRSQTADAQPPVQSDKFGDALPSGATARLGSLGLRVDASSFAITPDGDALLAFCHDTIFRFDTATGKLLKKTRLPDVGSKETHFSPDGKTLAIRQFTDVGWLGLWAKGWIEIWDTASARRVHILPVWPTHFAISPDGKWAATAEYDKEGRVRVWEVATGKEHWSAGNPRYAHDITFAPDGRWLYVSFDGRMTRCWNVVTGKEIWQIGHSATHLAVSPDGLTLASDAYLKKQFHLWDTATGQSLGEYELPGMASRFAFSPDGKTLVQVGGEAVFWDLATMTIQRRIATAGGTVAFSPDGRSLYSVGKMVQRWDLAKGELVYNDPRKDGHVGPVEGVAFAPDGKSLASWGEDSTVRIWNLADGGNRVLRSDAPNGLPRASSSGGPIPHYNFPLVFTPDGRQLLSTLSGHHLAFTEVESGKEIRRYNDPASKTEQLWLHATRLTQDGKTLLVRGSVSPPLTSGTIPKDPPQPMRTWDVASGASLQSRMLPVSQHGVAGFTPDGRLLVEPYVNKLYDVKTGYERQFMQREKRLFSPMIAFSADSRLLAATYPMIVSPSTEVRIYEIVTGELLCRMEAALGSGQPLSFSPDGQLIAAGGADALHIWQVSTGTRVYHQSGKGDLTYWSPAGFAYSLAFAPSGKSLATGHANGTILLWDLAPAWKELAPPGGELDVPACWDALANIDPQKAYAAIDLLAAHPAQALGLLKQKFAAVRSVDPKWLAARLADLNDDKFAFRDAAARELTKVAELVENELRRVLDKPPSTEVRNRVQAILKTQEGGYARTPTAEDLRLLRSVTVLERIGSPEARALLREWASGAALARLTQEANEALERVGG